MAPVAFSRRPSDVPVAADVVFRKSAGAQFSRLGEDFVVLDAEGRMLRGLNASGARVFELVDGKATAAQIAEQVSLEFGESRERVLADVLSFLSLLESKRLLEPAGVGQGG